MRLERASSPEGWVATEKSRGSSPKSLATATSTLRAQRVPSNKTHIAHACGGANVVCTRVLQASSQVSRDERWRYLGAGVAAASHVVRPCHPCAGR
eukprot:2408142-Prymnesium_polylepis.3